MTAPPNGVLLDWLERTEQGLPPPSPADAGTHALEKRLLDEGQLAAGARSSVRQVLDLELVRRVAMKVLDPRRVGSARDIARFDEEARILGRLDHPHIPAVHDVGRDSAQTRYFTMKLVAGPRLAELLRDFDVSDHSALLANLHVLGRVSDAVAFAHSRGIAHCDVKPMNITVGDHGQTFLMDWSVARVLPGTRAAGIDLETRDSEPGWCEVPPGASIRDAAGFTAPEQARAALDHVGPPTDVFGLGATLFQILTGRPPWDAPDLGRIVDQASEAALTPPWEVQPRSNRQLGELAMRAMITEPRDRTLTAAEFRDELERCLNGGGGAAAQRVFEGGETLMHEGERGKHAYLIGEGACRVFKTVAGSREYLHELGPGDVVGETAIISDQPRTASVVASTRVLATEISRESLSAELGGTFWIGRLTNALAKRFAKVNDERLALAGERDELSLTRDILQRMLIGTGHGPTWSLPWNTLRAQLSRQYGRTGPETSAIIRRIPLFGVDPETSQIVLITQDG